MTKRHIEAGIIGLGKFGMHLGETLARLGHTCIGLDTSPERVRHARDIFTQAYEGDGTDKAVLAKIRMHTMDFVVLAMGEKLEMAILATLNLQELGVSRIIARASTPVHKKVLERMGVGRIVQPEIDAAARLAYIMDNPGLIDLLPIGRGVAIQQAQVVNWAGKSLKELDLRHASNILVAAVRENGSEDYRFIPDPDRKLRAGESLLLIGYADGINSVLDRT